jgi:hypothetical protein
MQLQPKEKNRFLNFSANVQEHFIVYRLFNCLGSCCHGTAWPEMQQRAELLFSLNRLNLSTILSVKSFRTHLLGIHDTYQNI